MTRSRPFLLAFFAAAGALAACTAAAPKVRHLDPIDPGADYFGDPVAEEQPMGTTIVEDSGAFGAPARPATPHDAGTRDASTSVVDAGPAGPTYCDGALAAGDLVVTEILVASRAGIGDDGEWVEITSTRDCWLKLQGVSVSSPRGTAANTATITDAVDLAPHATFVVADSADPAKNHALPGTVFSWDATDVLKNDGDTVAVTLGATTIDSVTYPSYSNLVPGRSLAFPADCPASDRSDWQRWSQTFASWAPGFEGTPNASNDDVACF